MIYEFKGAEKAQTTLAQWIVDIQKGEKTKLYVKEPSFNGEKYILANEKIFHICMRKGKYVYYSTSNINDKETTKSFLKIIGWYDDEFIEKIDNYLQVEKGTRNFKIIVLFLCYIINRVKL